MRKEGEGGENNLFSCDLDEFRRRGLSTDFAASQTIVCLAHCSLGSAFHPRRKSVRSPYAHERRSRARARARKDSSGIAIEPSHVLTLSTSSSNRSATISTTWRSFRNERTCRRAEEQKSSIFWKLQDGYEERIAAFPVIVQDVELKCHDDQSKFLLYPHSIYYPLKWHYFKVYFNVYLFYNHLPS